MLPFLHLNEDGSWWVSSSYRPVEFWPYTSWVTDVVLETDWRGSSATNALREQLLKRFQDAGVRCQPDNKIVFGLEYYDDPRRFYVGFYDGKMTVGLGFGTDEWNIRRRYREVLESEFQTIGDSLNAAEFALTKAGIRNPDLNLAERILGDIRWTAETGLKKGWRPVRVKACKWGGCDGEVVDGGPCSRCGQKNI